MLGYIRDERAERGRLVRRLKSESRQETAAYNRAAVCSGDGQMWMHFAGRFKSLMSIYSHTTLNVPDLIKSLNG